MPSHSPKPQPPFRATTLLNQKMKTLQSIGTFNQTPVNYDQFDQSIVCKREVFVRNPFLAQGQQSQHKEQQKEERPNASRVQSDMGEIARMKMLFESRVNNQRQQAASRIHNKSMDRSPNTRSIEKHILKPTHTPSFNKFQPKNISYSIIQHSNLAPLQFTYQNPQSTLNQQQIAKRSQLIASSSKKSVMDCSEISSRFQEYEFGVKDNNRSAESRVGSENMHLEGRSMSMQDEMNANTTPKKIDFSQLKVLNPTPAIPFQQQQNKFPSPCPCQLTLTHFMNQTTAQISQLTQRLTYLQEQNSRLLKLQAKLHEQSQTLTSYRQQHQLLSQQCSQLRQSNYTHQAEKQQLQNLLKEILFKRQKEKFQRGFVHNQGSKENTYREQETMGAKRGTMRDTREMRRSQESSCNNRENHCYYEQQVDSVEEIGGGYGKASKDHMFSRKESTSNSRKSVVEPLGLKTSNVQQKEQTLNQKPKKQTDSKMKVQNLLSKLQIKIQKS